MMRNLFAAAALAATVGATAATERGDSISRLIPEVVVTGSNSAVEARLMPYTVSVIGSEQLQSQGSTQLLSLLSGEVPSLFVTQRGVFGFGVSSNGGAGHIKLRGVGGDRASAVLMMLDGQPQFAGLYSHHVADFYNKDYVERVEVLRGPSSVLYGSNAMAGTINVITRKAQRDGLHGSLTSQFGNFNTWQSTLNATARYGGFSALASVSYDRTDGNIKGMDFKEWSGYVKAGYDFSVNWKAYVDYSAMTYRAHDPVYPTLDDPESTDVYFQDIVRGEVSGAVTNSYGSTNGTARIYYSYGNHHIRDPRRFHSLDDRLGLMIYENFRPWRGAAATVGFDFATYSGKIPMSGGRPAGEGNLGAIERKSITEYSPYLTLSQGFWGDLLTISAGLRMANSDMFGTHWIPQAGAALNLPRLWTLKFSGAKGFRNPSFRELYLYRMANPDLQPEEMWNVEASLGKGFDFGLYVDATAYWSRGSNLIQTVAMKNVNTGHFINKGIELTARYRILPSMHVNASYSYLHSSIRDLTGAPRHQYFIGFDYVPFSGLRVSADVKGVRELFVDPAVKRQNYALVNLRVEVDVCRYLSVFARLENITDAHYVINRGYDMPGATFMGGFTLKL